MQDVYEEMEIVYKNLTKSVSKLSLPSYKYKVSDWPFWSDFIIIMILQYTMPLFLVSLKAALMRFDMWFDFHA